MPEARHLEARNQSALEMSSGSPRRETKNSSIVW
jgi:hypothetical protein